MSIEVENGAVDLSLADTRLFGVHHTARPTWKLAETVHFYRDVMGLPLIHAITARGWGPADHPDFLHFFFDSGDGSTIAFFYYIGTNCPAHMEPKDDYLGRSPHTAWRVNSHDQLQAWRTRLERHGVEVSSETQHELITSIYFYDPNGYMLEITLQTRPLEERDERDAMLSLQAAIELQNGPGLRSIDDVWRKKAQLVEAATL